MGRKIAFFICLTVECTFSIASAFAPNFWSWVALRFGVGLTVPAILESPLVLGKAIPDTRTCLPSVCSPLKVKKKKQFFASQWKNTTSAPSFYSITYLNKVIGGFFLAVELVGPQDRTYIITVVNIAYSIGLVLLSGIFYAVRDWRRLTLVTTLPFLILFFYWW